MSEREILASGELVDDDVGVTIRWSAESHCLTAEAKVHDRQPDGSVLFYRDDEQGVRMHTNDFTTAERLVGVWLKWDGCGEWNFGPRENGGRIHLCGQQETRRLAWVIDQMYALAATHVPHYAVWSTT